MSCSIIFEVPFRTDPNNKERIVPRRVLQVKYSGRLREVDFDGSVCLLEQISSSSIMISFQPCLPLLSGVGAHISTPGATTRE